ncbi:MAG: CHAP domain-containing protein [Hyphomonadaceae bacterium]
MTEFTRRTMLTGASVTAVLSACSPAERGAEQDPQAANAPVRNSPFEELQHGDPDTAYEPVTVDPSAVRAMAEPQRATFNPRDPEFGATLLAVAARFVGIDRNSNQPQVTSFLDLFDLPFTRADGRHNAYCAAGLCYAAAVAYQEYWAPEAPQVTLETVQISALRQAFPELDYYHFYPTPSVVDMYNVARGKRRWRDAQGSATKPIPEPGWIVIYNFGRVADHCGVVESVDGEYINTIEFNTGSGVAGDQRDGGMVARRQRAYNAQIIGFVET